MSSDSLGSYTSKTLPHRRKGIGARNSRARTPLDRNNHIKLRPGQKSFQSKSYLSNIPSYDNFYACTSSGESDGSGVYEEITSPTVSVYDDSSTGDSAGAGAGAGGGGGGGKGGKGEYEFERASMYHNKKQVRKVDSLDGYLIPQSLKDSGHLVDSGEERYIAPDRKYISYDNKTYLSSSNLRKEWPSATNEKEDLYDDLHSPIEALSPACVNPPRDVTDSGWGVRPTRDDMDDSEWGAPRVPCRRSNSADNLLDCGEPGEERSATLVRSSSRDALDDFGTARVHRVSARTCHLLPILPV